MKSILTIFGILSALNILAWIAVVELSQPQYLEVSFFEVGQGDSIFIETPRNHQILIDGGPDQKIIEELGREMPFWDRTIDLVVLTHPEYDHLSGLIEVLKRYRVEKVLWAGVPGKTSEYSEWLKALKEEKAAVYSSEAGGKIISGKAVFEVLHPSGAQSGDLNNSSLVLRLDFKNSSFLFTGDIYKSVERKLSGTDVDVLKVAHHGSRTSTAPEFVEAVSPEIAVIQCGRDNFYGHPHRETLRALEGVEVFRTDLHGGIKIVSDGEKYSVGGI